MGSPGPRPRATILKLIQGDKNTDRHKADRPKIDDLPQLPPGTVLSDAERSMWDWCMANCVMPGIHGTSDGPSFVKIVRLWARLQQVDAKIAEFGMVMKNPKTTKPELQPYTRLSRDLWQQLSIALAEVGMTPAGRVKIAGPRSGAGIGEPTSWDQIE